MKKKNIFEYTKNKNIKLFLKTELIFNNLKNINKINNYFSTIIFFLNISEIYKIIEKYNIKKKIIDELNEQKKKLLFFLKKPNTNKNIIEKILYIIYILKLKLKEANSKNNLIQQDEFLKQINKKIKYTNKKKIFFKRISEINYWKNLPEKKKILYYKKLIKPIKIIKQSNFNTLEIIRNLNTFKKYNSKKLKFKDKILKYKLIRIKTNIKYNLYPIVTYLNNEYYLKFISTKKTIINQKKIIFYLSKCK